MDAGCLYTRRQSGDHAAALCGRSRSRVTAKKRLLDSDNGLGTGPKTFEVVELPLERGEGMDDHIAVVEEHPAGIGGTLPVNGTFAFYLEYFLDLLGDGVYLPSAVCCDQHEIICEIADVPHIKKNDIGGLLFGCGFYSFACQIRCFQLQSSSRNSANYNTLRICQIDLNSALCYS